MADRVHPRASNDNAETPTKLELPSDKKQVPLQGTYVIQVPKDQIYHTVPSPDNPGKLENSSQKKVRHSFCHNVLWCLIALIFAAIFLFAVACAILYLVVQPEAPGYSVTAMAINGMNTTWSGSLSPEIDVTVRATNGNSKIGIYYESGSHVSLYYADTKLCDGALPVFYQPRNNVTVLAITLRGRSVVLTIQARQDIVTEQSQGKVPLKLGIRAPVKLEIGGVKTWKIAVKVTCDITVDKLTSTAQIETEDCHYGVDLLG